MITGSGLLAKAYAHKFSQREDVWIYAAGVSNSACTLPDEFLRERLRLEEALQAARHSPVFVYFSTCSIADPEMLNTPYVQHKLAMEQIVADHPYYLILRLPQVAGHTPNPHTLLNFLYAHIARSEAFQLWSKAKRNIIDVDDVVTLSSQLIADDKCRKSTVNVANPVCYPMGDIIMTMEKVVGKRAIYQVVDRGTAYPIDTQFILPMIDKSGIEFDDSYLERVIKKYYRKYE
jgi:nucleoside-diphosphate-sugar epimerase